MRAPASLRLWMILALALLVALIYRPSSEVLYEQWSDFANITFTHGWLILAVSVALVLHARRELAAAPVRAWPLAFWGLTGAILAWLISYRASIQDLHITLFPALYWLAAAAAFGRRTGRLLLFPVAFFYFAVPSWAQLGNPLEELTVIAMRGFLGLTGPHAVFDGDVIHIPNGSFVIQEGCSGLHFMIVGLAVAALHGELRRDPWRTRVAQLALMAALALLANWVRVYVIIEAGYLTDMRHYLVRVGHYWFGWGVFAVALVAFFWISTWFTSAPAPAAGAATAPEVPGPAARRPLAGYAAVVLLLAGIPAASTLSRQMHPPAPLDEVPAVTARAPWSAVPVDPESLWQPDYEGADLTDRRAVLSDAGLGIEVFTAHYRDQSQGAELVGESSTLLGPYLRYRGDQRVESAQGVFQETEAADPNDARSLIWWRYEIGGRHFVLPLASQLWYGLNATVWHPASMILALRAECRGDCAEARTALRALLASGGID